MTTGPILMYHAVNVGDDPYNIQVSPQRLKQQLLLLRTLGYRGVSVKRLLTPGRRRERLVGLSFDDGYTDFLTTAVPILAEFGFTATVYMVAGFLGGANSWDPMPPRRPLLTAADLGTVLSAGHEIGSHGMTHTSLRDVSADTLLYEVADSQRVLEDVIGMPVTGFCFPYGSYDANAVAEVRRRYAYACAVTASHDDDAWSLPRVFVGERDHPLRFAAKLGLRTSRHRAQARSRD
jgi:peptidoglycan/xylan/chitin deacetylase (PgdA/CDA1 family)